MLFEMLVDGGLFCVEFDAEDVSDDPVVVAGFEDVGTGCAECPTVGLLIPRETQDQVGQVPGQDGLLEEVASADEAERLSGPEPGDELWVSAVEGETAELGAGTIDMAGAQDGPRRVSRVSVDQLQLTEPFFSPYPSEA